MENNFLDCIIPDAKVDKLSVFTFHFGEYLFYLYFFLDKNDWLKIKKLLFCYVKLQIKVGDNRPECKSTVVNHILCYRWFHLLF